MGAPQRKCDGIIGPFQGKFNKKKLLRTYNDAYNQISNLWILLPESARTCLKSENMETDDAQLDSRATNSQIERLEDQLKLFRGKQASYKDKITKKKVKNKLKKKKKSEEKQLLRDEKKKKKKEMKEKILADKLNGKISGNPVEEIVDEVIEQLETLSANDEEPVKTRKHMKSTLVESPVQIPSNKKKKKEKQTEKIEDMAAEEAGSQKSTGLSKKKLKLIKKQELKAEKKRSAKKLKKLKREQEVEMKAEMIKEEKNIQLIENNENGGNDVDIMFNKMDLASDEQKWKFNKKDKLKREKDPVKALMKLEELNRKITDLKVSGQEEKATSIKEKDTWKKAILKADGVKVKDDVRLLKTTIKRIERKKNRSKEEWKKRTDIKDKKMADAQKKRKENILKKKKEKKQKKIKKSIKKGRVVI